MRASATFRTFSVIAVIGVALLGAGCAKKNAGMDGAGGMAGAGGVATPGTSQDFQVNVGDRVFFETDSSALTPQAQQTLERQAQWLRQYGNYGFSDRGPRRRARYTRIQHRAWSPPRSHRSRLHGRPWHRSAADAHGLLRQGTAGRRLRRHLLLVAEPPRCHRSRRRRFLTGT